jgi:ribosomal-protein-alanine N-acetyltransferase
MSVASIETKRLVLMPYSPEHLLAHLESSEKFERSFGRAAADGLRDFITSGDVSPAWLELLRASTSADPWIHGFAVVDKQTDLVVGGVGFVGPPVDGVVEIAYGIVPGFQGRGYATEAAEAGVAFARGQGVSRVIAHTLPTRNPSTRVLERCAFVFVGPVEHPEDGLVWRWQLDLTKAP